MIVIRYFIPVGTVKKELEGITRTVDVGCLGGILWTKISEGSCYLISFCRAALCSFYFALGERMDI